MRRKRTKKKVERVCTFVQTGFYTTRREKTEVWEVGVPSGIESIEVSEKGVGARERFIGPSVLVIKTL